MIKDDIDLAFYIEQNRRYDSTDRTNLMLGFYNDFNDAKMAMEKAFMENIFNGLKDVDVSEDDKSFEDLLVKSAQHIMEDNFCVIAIEQGVPLTDRNQIRVYSASLLDDPALPVSCLGFGEMGLSYAATESNKAKYQARISEEFSKSDKNMNLVKSLQKDVEMNTEKLSFIEKIVNDKSELTSVAKNHGDISVKNTKNFMAKFEDLLKKHDKELFNKLKTELNENKYNELSSQEIKNPNKRRI